MAKKLSPLSVGALAAGGMVGGGIYTVLGVVIAVSGQWSWFSFIFIGIFAVTSAYSYVFLSNKFGKSGGAFAFLEKVNDKKLAGNLSWMLIIGYVLTISVYAYAFGHYVSFAFHGGYWSIRILALGITAILIILNLAGIGKMTKVEIIIVSVNLLVLLSLGIYGLTKWDSTQLVAGIEPRPVWSGLIGGAAIFMAYEGFQLLSYEYDRIRDPQKYFMPVLVIAVLFVIFIYVSVALGATFIAGASSLINYKQIALSIAAQEAFGRTGAYIMTVAAGFATAAAINSTLFSTANLSQKIAGDGELPSWFDHTNQNNVPDRSIIILGIMSGVLAVTGSLTSLVEAASLVFVCTFGIVNWLCWRESEKRRWLPFIGILIGAITATSLLFRVTVSKPLVLGGLIIIIVLIILVRPMLLSNYKRKKNDS